MVFDRRDILLIVYRKSEPNMDKNLHLALYVNINIYICIKLLRENISEIYISTEWFGNSKLDYVLEDVKLFFRTGIEPLKSQGRLLLTSAKPVESRSPAAT